MSEPAMNEMEWATGSWRRHDGTNPQLHKLIDVVGTAVILDGCWVFASDERHAIAAMCLHGQPFGFTREDVDALQAFTAGLMSKSYGGPGGPIAQQLDSLADRIEALLPPKREP